MSNLINLKQSFVKTEYGMFNVIYKKNIKKETIIKSVSDCISKKLKISDFILKEFDYISFSKMICNKKFRFYDFVRVSETLVINLQSDIFNIKECITFSTFDVWLNCSDDSRIIYFSDSKEDCEDFLKKIKYILI